MTCAQLPHFRGGQSFVARIEADQWHEHNVELARRAWRTAARLENAECASTHLSRQVEEAHAVITQADHLRQRHPATALACQCQQGCRIDLFGSGEVEADATAGSQQSRGGDASRQHPALLPAWHALDGAAACAQFAPPFVAGLDEFDEMVGALRQVLDEAWERINA